MAAVPSRSLHARLAAAELLLHESPEDERTVLSAVHAAAARAHLTRELSLMSLDGKVGVIEHLKRIRWAATDKKSLLALFEVATDLGGPRKRRSQQSWQGVVDFYPRSAWDTFQDEKVSTMQKLDVILRVPMQLGLRLPSEKTFHALASLWIVVSDAVDSPAHTKMAMQASLKIEFHRRRRKSEDVTDLLEELELSAIKEARPEIYELVYQRSPQFVCPPQISQMLLQVSISYGCRSSMHAQISTPAAQSSPMERSMLSMFETGMRMLSNIVMERTGSSDNVNIEDLRSQTPLRRPPQLHFSPFGDRSTSSCSVSPQLQVSPAGTNLDSSGVSMLCLNSPMTTPRVELELQAADASRVTLLQAPVHVSTLATPSAALIDAAPASSGATDSQRKRSAELYSMLQERDDAKKEEQREKKKRARADDADAQGTGDAKSKDTASCKAAEKKQEPSKPCKPAVTPNSKPCKPAVTPASKKDVVPPVLCKPSPKPSFSHEASRSQYLCRTGLKGKGQSYAIKYGAGGHSKRNAEQLAEQWVAKAVRELALE
jgi:hypothetical protein